jgi:hypothetical protein
MRKMLSMRYQSVLTRKRMLWTTQPAKRAPRSCPSCLTLRHRCGFSALFPPLRVVFYTTHNKSPVKVLYLGTTFQDYASLSNVGDYGEDAVDATHAWLT